MHCEESRSRKILIEKAQHGDCDAVELLLSEYKPLLHCLSGRVDRSTTSADELMQAGYLGLLQALSHYDGMRNTRFITYAVPWILGEMKKAIRQSTFGRAVVSMQEVMNEDGTTLEDTLSSCENIDLSGVELRLALEKISSEERLLICLRFFRDKTQKETADLMKKSQAQISRTERRALDKLHAIMRG